eukprot:c17905_g1_i1.p1 GENE.c17905_g1_i1~~c17905_g1_i1.p1  ORF type:complete len:309 (+),score=82.49 c17905_g1_i1:152-1078(+)
MLGLGAAGLASFFGDFVRAMASARRVFQLIDSRRHIDKATAGGSLPSVQGRVTFQNVSFAYKSRKDQPVLNNLSFEIEPGKITAVTGPSGVGKSTVAALLTKLYTPTAGTILLDGQDIAMLSPKWLRSKIYVVPQQPAIFSGWLIDAVRHGTAANDSQVVNALEQANLGEFVKSLPHGLYTEVGEKGVMLSGGQIQRIAIARAFLRDPAVLVLDEATSNLDTESERAVTEVLAKLMKGRTVLVIAHRESIIRMADCVVGLGPQSIVNTTANDVSDQTVTNEQTHDERQTEVNTTPAQIVNPVDSESQS